MARKEHDCRQRELDHAQEMAILIAEKKVAIANAKLKAIEEALQEDDYTERVSIPEIPEDKVEQRTDEWVNSVTSQEHDFPMSNPATRKEGYPQDPPENTSNPTPIMTAHNNAPQATTPSQDGVTAKAVSYSPTQASQVGPTERTLIESLTLANKQIVAGLARQNLPKCHPDIFSGDAPLFHPWKRAFKGMIKDTSVTAEQEINYLRSFTRGEVQRVVDNFRIRHQNDPVTLLQDLWKELEARFGSQAVITNALLERLQRASNFHEKDYAKL